MIEGMTQVLMNLDLFSTSLIQKASEAVARTVVEAENTAKNGAPWTDRTSNARNSILGSGPETRGSTVVGALSIGVFYGKYLELSNGGKYRIVGPTADLVFPTVLNKF